MAYFLWLPEVKGDATEANHKGEIELQYAQVQMDGINGGGGTGQGAPRIRGITMGKKQDGASLRS